MGIPFIFNDYGKTKEVITPAKVIIKKQGNSEFASAVTKDVLFHCHSSVTPTDDTFHRDSYKGGAAYILADYLFTHEIEKSEAFVERKKRSYYYNYCRPVIDSYLFFLFKANPLRLGDQATEDDVLKFIADPSKGTETLNDLMKLHAFDLLLNGRAWFRFDKPVVPPLTVLEDKDRTKLPYLFRVPPRFVLDWAESEEGQFAWVKFYEFSQVRASFAETSSLQVVKIITPDAIAIYDLEGTLLSLVENPLGLVPFIKTSLNEENQSFIADIAIVNRSIYNWCSLLDEILYKQTFSQLVVPGSSGGTKFSERKVGIASAFTFDAKATHAPHFIAPDVQQATVLRDQIGEAIMEIYRAANLEWVDSKRSTNKSGMAKSFDFQNTNKILAGVAGELELTETRVFKLYYMLRGRPEEPAFSTQYPRDFSVAALESELTNIFFALTRQISRTFNIYLKKRVVALIAPRIDESLRLEIEQEIDSNEPEDETDSNLSADKVKDRVRQLLEGASISNVKGQPGKTVQDAVTK